jgi:hypothetical protein
MWGRMYHPAYHAARFILIGLYSATRHEAILGLCWAPNSKSGWFHLECQVMYRREQGLQRSIPIWEVAGFIGASEKVIRDIYGHHSPEHLSGPKKRFPGQNLGGGQNRRENLR